MDINIDQYNFRDAEDWDNLVAASTSGTFLHSRRFLAYHGDRFHDESLCLRAPDGALLGVIPAARDPHYEEVVVSHPGITYGGIVHAGKLKGAAMLSALSAVIQAFRNIGYRKLRYKSVPRIYHTAPAEDDLYALFRLNALRYRCDVSVAVDLAGRLPVSARRQRGYQKAFKAGLIIKEGIEYISAFWAVLEENLRNRHGVRPTHTLDEISLLWARFPNHMRLVVALEEGSVVAGTLLFLDNNVHHAQYIAATPRGHQLSALDFIFSDSIKIADAAGARYFDFGICNKNDGSVINDGLYNFKAEFGGAGVVHEFYEIEL